MADCNEGDGDLDQSGPDSTAKKTALRAKLEAIVNSPTSGSHPRLMQLYRQLISDQCPAAGQQSDLPPQLPRPLDHQWQMQEYVRKCNLPGAAGTRPPDVLKKPLIPIEYEVKQGPPAPRRRRHARSPQQVGPQPTTSEQFPFWGTASGSLSSGHFSESTESDDIEYSMRAGRSSRYCPRTRPSRRKHSPAAGASRVSPQSAASRVSPTADRFGFRQILEWLGIVTRKITQQTSNSQNPVITEPEESVDDVEERLIAKLEPFHDEAEVDDLATPFEGIQDRLGQLFDRLSELNQLADEYPHGLYSNPYVIMSLIEAFQKKIELLTDWGIVQEEIAVKREQDRKKACRELPTILEDYYSDAYDDEDNMEVDDMRERIDELRISLQELEAWQAKCYDSHHPDSPAGLLLQSLIASITKKIDTLYDIRYPPSEQSASSGDQTSEDEAPLNSPPDVPSCDEGAELDSSGLQRSEEQESTSDSDASLGNSSGHQSDAFSCHNAYSQPIGEDEQPVEYESTDVEEAEPFNYDPESDCSDNEVASSAASQDQPAGSEEDYLSAWFD